MDKKKWILIVVAVLVVFEIINNIFLITPLSKIIKGYTVFGSDKCDENSKIHHAFNLSNVLDVMVDCKCEICGKEFETSGGRYILCMSCSAFTHRCPICGLKK